MSRVIVVGSVNEDLLVHAPIPAPGETVSARRDFARLPGGKGANAASAAARLGAPTWLVGAVGDDAAGERALAELRAAGVAVEQVVARADAATGQAIVVVDDDGENAIVIAAGANGTIDDAMVTRGVAAALAVPGDAMMTRGVAAALAVPGGATAPGSVAVRAMPGGATVPGAARAPGPAAPSVPGAVLLTNLEIPLDAVAAAARAATAHGLRFVLDPAPAQPLPPSLIPPGAVIVPNEHELTQLGRTPEQLLAAGAEAVIVTLGAAGADVYAAGESDPPSRVSAPHINAIDTTGAGDAFRGALAAALAEGAELLDAVRLATAAGAHATTAQGARGALADRAALDALLTR